MAEQTPVSWGMFDDAFVDALAAWIGERSVLETFAGNGLLASKLAARGVKIRATTLFSGHDGHERGLHYRVEELDAAAAVERYGAAADILLMSWPTVTEAATLAALKWGTERPILFIGEVTDLANDRLGGCATDLFFELTRETEPFAGYTSRNMLESAAVRRLDREAVRNWADRNRALEAFQPEDDAPTPAMA